MTIEHEMPFIGGERRASSGATFRSTNPATNSVVAEVCLGTASDIDDAVDAATEAQRNWWRRSPWERAQAMWAWGGLIERDAKRLADTDVEDTGKTLNDALPEAGGATRIARYWSGSVERLVGYQIPTLNGHLSYTKREPLGVVAIILPWNGPTATFVARTAPALACGNAIVVKPSEYSPRSAALLAELSVEAGMPPGLVNVVQGDGSTGALLASHHGVNGVSFTGSVNTGRKVAQAAVGHFAKPLMELGGKAPNIVFADADIEAAIRGSIWGVFQNAGQICVASTRLLVAADVADEFTSRLAEQAKNVRVGDPFQRSSHIGPIVSERQYDKVVDYIQVGHDEGATMLTGGGDKPLGTNPNGFFVQPTVFAGVTPGMRIASEEIFGPVLSILTFENETEAIELANELDYGLSANIWTKDLDRALRLADEVQAGNIWVNSPRIMDPSLPFGGFKNSGIGNANGFDVLEELTQTKRVSINYAGAAPGWSDLARPADNVTA